MASLRCAHCARQIFLRPHQLPPRSGLCPPCGDHDTRQRSAHHAWRRFRDRLLLEPIEAPKREPLLPSVDLRHL